MQISISKSIWDTTVFLNCVCRWTELFGKTVGLRPFRTIGPRLESEQLGSKTLVHNYGHGGSGWSLSWGSGMLARDEVMKTGVKQVAVIGAGTIGLTTARLLQELSGFEVTIYAKDVAPNVTSSLATGTWSPPAGL